MKRILILITLAIISFNSFAQTSEQENSVFYVNVFINKNKDIRVENNLTAYENVSKEVKKIVYNHPFKLNESIAYRIYADETLMLGFIMDVEQKMFDGFSQNVWRERYLLETVQMDIDGPNWLQKLDGLKLERTRG